MSKKSCCLARGPDGGSDGREVIEAFDTLRSGLPISVRWRARPRVHRAPRSIGRDVGEEASWSVESPPAGTAAGAQPLCANVKWNTCLLEFTVQGSITHGSSTGFFDEPRCVEFERGHPGRSP